MAADAQQMSLTELAEKAGLPGRTVRFYIARGLLPGPLKAGRDAAYGAAHLARLREIARLQTEGLTLAEIAGQAVAKGQGFAGPEPAPCWQFAVADDVAVTVRANVSPWRMKQIRNQIAQMAAALREPERN
jgi:DNA-binding transcriptional MerR regulator